MPAKLRNDMLALVWAPEEARTANFAARLQIPVYNVHYLLYKRPYVAPFKYVVQWFKTWAILFSKHPRYVYVTNPPIFAVLCVFCFCLVTGSKYIMDTHSPALFSRKWGWTLPLQRLMARYALTNVVDQERFAKLFQSWGARTVILEKPPKDSPYPNLTATIDPDFFDVAVVNTFAVDEPLDIILEAARQLPHVRFFIMGDKTLARPAELATAPANAIFTGYLFKEAYWERLFQSRAVMVLTTYPFSLLAGAQDGAVLSKPLILSEQPALTEYFNKGAVFVKNTAQGIVDGVQAVQARENQLRLESGELTQEKQKRWDQTFQTLVKLTQPRGSVPSISLPLDKGSQPRTGIS